MEETDAVVIGAGPVGLFQVFQLGLQGLKAHLIDALPHAGGQCVELYGDKPIYDIPGVPVCTGRELVALLLKQIAPFAPHWHLGSMVSSLAPQPDGRVLVQTDTGAMLLARAVFVAAGVGAFVPRTLKTEGIEVFVGTQVFYQSLPTGFDTAGRHVVVHGGDESAVACALDLAERSPATRITLLHRRDVFQAPDALLQRLQHQRDTGRIVVEAVQITGIDTTHDHLNALRVVDAEGAQRALALDVLVAVLGLSPRLGPLADWGLAMERKQLVVDPATFATSVPGIYAVGDIVTYPGKRKLILSGFHEATLAAFGAAEWLAGHKLPLEYTTSSAKLQGLLGVAAAQS
ncbi:NAD(P)/FAD-dependent oxidoreductase [Acidovorax radicis]|uniref:NAD(P)/FAD-dependent oxidoreductase n=1 Tax=Acidovorax radicis TaxID=758826 RepID=UPI001CF9D071|nr:NAD(P)/FAD-dependent oxidoreductase [Acidovorax radicis]UCV01481.1 NAD(P)/FAD-dependent oxidoreductase [Acidovorax radicis]